VDHLARRRALIAARRLGGLSPYLLTHRLVERVRKRLRLIGPVPATKTKKTVGSTDGPFVGSWG
jgi:hypothetical protein